LQPRVRYPSPDYPPPPPSLINDANIRELVRKYLSVSKINRYVRAVMNY
jgi:hypothetical protein